MRASNKIITFLKESVSVIEALELVTMRVLGFAALPYQLVRGFFHGK